MLVLIFAGYFFCNITRLPGLFSVYPSLYA